MAHVPLFWVVAFGLVLALGLVGGGSARMREQRRHVREIEASGRGAPVSMPELRINGYEV